MEIRKTLYASIIMAAIMFLPEQSKSQNLEVVGQAKITVMNTDNTAEQVVVKQSDGTLAVRDVATLSAQSIGNYGTVVNPVTGKVWLDRNLGASQVATSSDDAAREVTILNKNTDQHTHSGEQGKFIFESDPFKDIPKFAVMCTKRDSQLIDAYRKTWNKKRK